MPETLTFNGRLPGVLCETTVPAQPQNPLRLDIAGFVGFAQRGPLDMPVLIEDLSQYQRIFGGDLPLALDEGRPVYAHLLSAVDAFFENGGRRCYVVRVAGNNRRANRFQIPGLLFAAGDNTANDWQPVTAPAAWPGRWSDFVTTGAALRTQPLAIRNDDAAGDGPVELAGSTLNDGTFSLALRAPVADAVRAGDLLRLHIGQPDDDGEIVKSHLVYLSVGEVLVESTLALELFGVPIEVVPQADSLTIFSVRPDASVPDRIDQMTAGGWQSLPADASTAQWTTPGTPDSFQRLTFDVPALEALNLPVEPGDLLRLAGPGPTAATYLIADRIERNSDPLAPGVVQLAIDSRDPLQSRAALANEAFQLMQVDLLSFDLHVCEGEETQEVWRNLRFSQGSGYWRNMLMPEIDRAEIYPLAFQIDDFLGRSLLLGQSTLEPGRALLPIGMGATPRYVTPLPDTGTTGKDGLDVFDPIDLFADEAFLNTGTRTLMREANELLYLGPQTRRLRGIHSLLPMNDVAILAVPDLAHAGWAAYEQPIFTDPTEPDPPQEEQSGFHDCPPPATDEPDEGENEEVNEHCPPPMPVITLPPNGEGGLPSIQAQLEKLPDQNSPAEHDDVALMDMQRLLIRACSARADMVALLSLPQHYSGRVIEQWHEDLTNTPDFYDGRPLSYAAVYHPWTGVRETTTPSLAPLRYVPPDGTAAGMIAARERQRGAWIAPANVALRTVADLAPDFTDVEWAPLYNRQINVLRRQPGRYAAMSALTLARDRSLVQISVRRLLIFLRKLALREGQRYVFETNNARFRTLVQTYFENVLAQLLDRGGISAYQVITNAEINTQQDYDSGRFLIALKIAPTLPIEFITIIMLRSGDDGIDILEI